MRLQAGAQFPEFASKSFSLLPGVAVPALTTALALPVLTRVLPSQQFGLFSILTSLLLLSQSLTSGWLNTAIIRYRPAIHARLEKGRFELTVYRQVVSWSMYATVPYVAGLLVAIALQYEVASAYWLLPVQVLALNAISAMAQMDRADGNAALFNGLNTGRALFSVALGLASVWAFGPSAFSYMCGSTAAWVFIAVLPGYRFLRLSRDGVAFDAEARKILLKFGLPLIPTFVFVQLLDVSDRFVIGGFLGQGAVGAYAASYMLASLPFQMMILVLGAAAAPHLVRLWEFSPGRSAEEFCQMLCRTVLILGIPLVVSTVTNVPDFGAIIGAGSLATGTSILPLVSTAGLLLALQWVAQRGLLLQERTRTILVAYCVAAIVNILANVALVPTLGIMGAAWSTLGCNLLVLVLIGRSVHPFRWWPRYTEVAFICLVAAPATLVASVVAANLTGELSAWGSALRLGSVIVGGATVSALLVVLHDRATAARRPRHQNPKT